MADTTKSASATITLIPLTISMSPASANLYGGQTAQFSASIQKSNNTGVTWTISPVGVGSVSATGLYTAPSAVPSATTVSVIAASAADPTKTASAQVTLSPLTMTIGPASANLNAGQTQQYSAQVNHNTNTAVTWSINPVVGTISASGQYTAPAILGSQRSITITATSVADPTKSVSSIATLISPVSVSPASVTLSVSQMQQFTATVTGMGNTPVTWSISPSVGSVSASGLYTAPASITGGQTVLVIATSVGDPTKKASSTVTLVPPVAVAVSPTAATLTVSQTLQFTANVTGSTNTAVTWTLTGAGSITSAGLYTAPSSIPAQTSATVTAVSVADTTKSASATITLNPPVAVTVAPATATLTAAQTLQFAATVTGSTNTAVTWTATGAGSITSAGLYTAPSNITAQSSATVTATSVADTTKSASATITVNPPVAVTVSPATATLTAAQTLQFAATVTGSTNTAVTWTATGAGSISPAGLYTAPSNITAQTTATVTATSVADTTKSASATVTVNPPVVVTVSPATATLSASQTSQFAATVTGSTNTSVTWSVNGAGAITSAGLYTAPASIATQGTATVTATSAADSTKSASGTITLIPVPSISVLSPTSGPVGTAITITGSGFGALQGSSTVAFNGTNAGTASSWSDSSIAVVVPIGASTGNLVVTANGLASNGVLFTVAASPVISSLSPTSAAVGAVVTITGSNFGASQGSSTVTFNGASAGTASSWSATNIFVVVPSGATTGNVVVTVNGVPSSGAFFTVAVTPSVSGVSPTAGTAGTVVTISGSGFGAVQGSGMVWLGSTLGTVVSWSDTQVVATVASNATSGTARVRQSGLFSNAVPFTVNTAMIVSVSPASGVPGTVVTIAGSGFGAVRGTGQVWLGTVNGVVQSWSDTQVVALVASGAASANAQVLQNGVMSNAVPFKVNTLQLTSISPTSGSVGTSVTFTGTGFGASQGSGVVWLGSIAGQVVSWSDTQVVATVAAGALSGIARIQQNGMWSNAFGFKVPVTGGGGSVASLSPSLINMAVGDTHVIQASNAAGQPVTGLTWTSSNPAIVSLSTDDPPVLTGLAVGHVTITAGTASADVNVLTGPLALGTVLWSNPGDGSDIYSIVPAVPSPTGIADVFAIQQDGTVQAITADGTLAWTANPGPAYQYLADFQGGLIVSGNDGSGNPSAMKLDGLTGLPHPAVAGAEAVHPDGTVFTAQIYSDGSRALLGFDPIAGAQKFSVPFGAPNGAGGEYGLESGSPIIAGDGYAYLTYEFITYDCGDNCETTNLHLLRVDTGGGYQDIPIIGLTSGITDRVTFHAGVFTNADQGVVLNFSEADQPYMAIVTGGGAGLVQAPAIPNQSGSVTPVLQAQDGSFVGTVDDNDANEYMVAFDLGGAVRWTVANEYPKVATADGGVIGTSGIIYDRGGSATGMMNNQLVFSWPGNAYTDGPVDLVLANPVFLATSWWALQGANNSANGSATNNPRYPPLPSCTYNPTGTCQGPPQTGDFVWNAKQDLVAQLQNDQVCMAAAKKWVFDIVTTTGLLGSGFFAPPLDPPTFVSYLAQTPRFYNGVQSALKYRDAFCGETVRVNCMPDFNGLIAAYFTTHTDTAITVTPSHPLKIFWQPQYTPVPLNVDEGFGQGVDSSNNGVNIHLESTLFHEALHGFTGWYDSDIEGFIHRGPPSLNISEYIKDNVLSSCPSFRACATNGSLPQCQ